MWTLEDDDVDDNDDDNNDIYNIHIINYYIILYYIYIYKHTRIKHVILLPMAMSIPTVNISPHEHTHHNTGSPSPQHGVTTLLHTTS